LIVPHSFTMFAKGFLDLEPIRSVDHPHSMEAAIAKPRRRSLSNQEQLIRPTRMRCSDHKGKQ